MEARLSLPTALLALAVSLAAPAVSFGASYRTSNFIVEAPTPELAEKIGKSAEYFRRELAVQWIGAPMQNWSHPCPIRAEVAPNLGAGGATSFVFDHGEVFNWDMKIQGSEERVLDSVLPHEVTHTIFASHFRQPLPRWADEGACTTVEHASERNKQATMLISFLKTGRGIGFTQMFAMKEYPADVLPLYSQGYSLARYLIEQGGRRKFIDFVGDGMKSDNWSSALQKHYSISNIAVLQNKWLDWVKQGSPNLGPDREVIASADKQGRPETDPVYRAQSDDRRTVQPAGYSRSRSASEGAAGLVQIPGADASRSARTEPASSENSGGSWYASRRSNRASAAVDSDTDSISAPTASRDSAGAQPSDYDQSDWTGPPKNPSSDSAREPLLVASRDDGSPSGRRVLLKWDRPQ